MSFSVPVEHGEIPKDRQGDAHPARVEVLTSLQQWSMIHPPGKPIIRIGVTEATKLIMASAMTMDLLGSTVTS